MVEPGRLRCPSELPAVARKPREGPGAGHHLDAGVDLVGERRGELLVRRGERVDALAVDVVDPADAGVVAVQLEVAVGVPDRVAVGVLADRDRAGHVVEILEERHVEHRQVLHHDRLGRRGDDEVLHLQLGAGLPVLAGHRTTVGDVDDHRQLARRASLRHGRLEPRRHVGEAVVGDHQVVGVLEVAEVDVDRLADPVSVREHGDRAVAVDVEREAEGPDEHLLHLLLPVQGLHRAGAVDHHDDLEPDAGEVDVGQGLGGGLVGLAQVHTGLAEVHGRHLVEADRGLVVGVEVEHRRTDRPRGGRDQTGRAHERRTGVGTTGLAEHGVS